jgi:hypothetical protein
MAIKRSWSSLWAAAFFAAVGLNLAHAAPLMIVGNDEKLLWDDDGKPIISPAGKDSVLIVDLADPENPKIVANLPMKNSVVGPPVNVAPARARVRALWGLSGWRGNEGIGKL